jgi:streptogramin lyase
MLFFLVLFFLGLMSASITHAETYTFVTKWGSSGSGHGEFNKPMGVAFNYVGDIYVIDNFNNRVQKFYSNDRFITTFGSIGSSSDEFNCPEIIAFDSRGNFYITDSMNARIKKYYSNNTFDTAWGSSGNGPGKFTLTTGLAIDSSNNIYVTDRSNNSIQKFNSTGNFITMWGSSGINNGQFSDPWRVAVDSFGNVYVADRGNNRVQKFDCNGNFITKWGSFGSNAGQFKGYFNYPIGIAVDKWDNVYVADTGNNRVQKFDCNGNFITMWGSTGRGNGQFVLPGDVAVDSMGIVYVADTGNDRIQKFANPAQTIHHMVNFVQGLATSGELNSVVADSLTFELANINKNLCIQESCLNIGNAKVAIDELKTFNHQIETYITTLALSPRSGQKLIDAANDIIVALDHHVK